VFLTDKQVAELVKFEAQFMKLRPGPPVGVPGT
jgi:hypothetical protein